MNDSMILMARLRRGEMIREANRGKLAAAAARLRHRQQRAAQAAQASGGPVPRPSMKAARMRPTVTGR